MLTQFTPSEGDLELGLIDIVILFKNQAQIKTSAAVLGPLRVRGLVGQISRMAVDSQAIDYLKEAEIPFTVIDSYSLRLRKESAPFHPGVPWLWGWVNADGRAWVRHKPEFFWDEG